MGRVPLLWKPLSVTHMISSGPAACPSACSTIPASECWTIVAGLSCRRYVECRLAFELGPPRIGEDGSGSPARRDGNGDTMLSISPPMVSNVSSSSRVSGFLTPNRPCFSPPTLALVVDKVGDPRLP